MKKTFPLFFSLVILITLLTCCKASDESSLAIQALYDRSIIAKEYTQEIFFEKMKDFGNSYSIEQVSYGFIPDITPIYLVGYQYKVNNTVKTYAYKLIMSDDEIPECTILEEGEKVADFLFSE